MIPHESLQAMIAETLQNESEWAELASNVLASYITLPRLQAGRSRRRPTSSGPQMPNAMTTTSPLQRRDMSQYNNAHMLLFKGTHAFGQYHHGTQVILLAPLAFERGLCPAAPMAARPGTMFLMIL